MLENMDEGRIICKDQILQAVDEKVLEISATDDDPEKAEYRKMLSGELARFRKSIEGRIVLTLSVDDWRYAIVVRGSGIYLLLEHVLPKELGVREEEKIDEQYEMISCKAKLLNVETYSEMHNISHVAAVTRIRRGKIRSAVKVGKQWRIPALAEPVERGYRSAVYGWHNCNSARHCYIAPEVRAGRYGRQEGHGHREPRAEEVGGTGELRHDPVR